MREDLKQQGYDKEEEYFRKLNQKLIEERRKKLDAEKGTVPEAPRSPHWMKCPKCGADMVEQELAGILVDQCGACHGVYFDAGEVQTLIDAQESKSFVQCMRGLFR
jgi:hypothetical protein